MDVHVITTKGVTTDADRGSLQWILTCHSNAMSNVATGDRSFQNGEKLLVKSWAKSTTFPRSTVAFLEEYRKTATAKNVNCSLYMYNGLKSPGSDNYCQRSPARDTTGNRAVVEPSGFTSALCTRETPHHGMPQYWVSARIYSRIWACVRPFQEGFHES